MTHGTDDGAAATGLKQSTPAYALAAVVPEMALPPPVSTEAVAAAMPTGLLSTRDAEAQISSQMPALSPARLPAPPLQSPTWGPSRRALHSMNTSKLSSPTSRQAVDLAKTPSHATTAQDLTIKGTGEDGQPLFFEKLLNATCEATDILRLGPAYLTPREGPAYLVQAHFFRSRDGRPWVTLYYTGAQKSNLAVILIGDEVEFTRSHDMIYKLSPSHNNHLVNFAKHPNGGTVDFACWGENTHPS